MRIERHDVRDEALAKATEDFADRIGGAVRGQQHFGRDLHGWDMIADDLRDYAGARSAAEPAIDADARAALYSAAEARIGALKLDHAPASASFSVHLTYTGTGLSYSGEGDDTDHDGAPTWEWIRTLYLCLVADLHEQNAGALLSLASAFDEGEVLARGLAYYLFPELGAQRDQVLGYVDSAVTGMANAGEPPHPDLLQLYTLLSRNEELFWKMMAARLEAHRDSVSEDSPRSLLPIAEIAYAAMAVRLEGWEQPFGSDYLPHRLVAGEQGRGGPRVGAYGADKDPGALRELARGELAVERPVTVPDHIDRLLETLDEDSEEDLGDAWSPDTVSHMLPAALQWNARDEITRFRYRSLVDPQARDPRQLEALTHASQYTAAALASVASREDTVEVTLGPTTAPLRSVAPTRDTSEGARMVAAEYAVLSGSRERLDALVSYPTDAFTARDDTGTSVYGLYRTALLAHLRAESSRSGTGEEVRAAMDEAVAALERHHALPGHPPPPVILLSQLVEGDRDGFALALVDALEEHREAFSVGGNHGDSDGFVDTRVLALACLARARGWDVPVESDYLPRGVLDHAATLFA
ncbi:immunity 49 family protein [Nocardiopsis halotolerans]|uniref:immunity 49 family protein n=1 Tax=Nocardiopsis halotolerans TaxID=124252 RepID=UPI00035F30F5|nr:immunity 49 family protein [Nocardiopsis halotolerans]